MDYYYYRDYYNYNCLLWQILVQNLLLLLIHFQFFLKIAKLINDCVMTLVSVVDVDLYFHVVTGKKRLNFILFIVAFF